MIGDKIRPAGVYYHDLDRNKHPIDDWIMGPLHDLAKTANRDDSEHGLMLSFTSRTGIPKKWAMPMRLLASYDGQEIRAYLQI